MAVELRSRLRWAVGGRLLSAIRLVGGLYPHCQGLPKTKRTVFRGRRCPSEKAVAVPLVHLAGLEPAWPESSRMVLVCTRSGAKLEQRTLFLRPCSPPFLVGAELVSAGFFVASQITFEFPLVLLVQLNSATKLLRKFDVGRTICDGLAPNFGAFGERRFLPLTGAHLMPGHNNGWGSKVMFVEIIAIKC